MMTQKESSVRGEGRCHCSISNVDEFELMKYETTFEWYFDLYNASSCAAKEIVNMTREVNLDTRLKGGGEYSSLEEVPRTFSP